MEETREWWARQVAGPARVKAQRLESPGPGLRWAAEGERRGGGNTERVSHRFWARQAAAAERGAHSWLAGRPALMSFPHGPEFPARHDHTGKALPRPPPPQLLLPTERGRGEGVWRRQADWPLLGWEGVLGWASQGPAPRAAAAPPATNRAVSLKVRQGRASEARAGRRPDMSTGPWPRPYFSGPRSSSPALCKALAEEEGFWRALWPGARWDHP